MIVTALLSGCPGPSLYLWEIRGVELSCTYRVRYACRTLFHQLIVEPSVLLAVTGAERCILPIPGAGSCMLFQSFHEECGIATRFSDPNPISNTCIELSPIPSYVSLWRRRLSHDYEEHIPIPSCYPYDIVIGR